MRLVTLLIALGTSACSITSAEPVSSNPLVVAHCPALVSLNDPSFGATTMKLIEVAGQYRECRAAALNLPEGEQ